MVPGVCREFAGTIHSKVFLRGLCIMLRAIGAQVSSLVEFQSLKAEICLILVVTGVFRENAQKIFNFFVVVLMLMPRGA